MSNCSLMSSLYCTSLVISVALFIPSLTDNHVPAKLIFLGECTGISLCVHLFLHVSVNLSVYRILVICVTNSFCSFTAIEWKLCRYIHLSGIQVLRDSVNFQPSTLGAPKIIFPEAFCYIDCFY